MAKRFRATIGHYGGLYADVPSEHWQEFKQYFPKNIFPRKVRTISTQEAYTFEGEKRFHQAFPKSKGTIHTVYFADRSKGVQALERLIDIQRKKGYNPFEETW